jgi:hypothetical protein
LVEEKKERNRRERNVFNFRKTKISLYFNFKKKDNMLQYKLKKKDKKGKVFLCQISSLLWGDRKRCGSQADLSIASISLMIQAKEKVFFSPFSLAHFSLASVSLIPSKP